MKTPQLSRLACLSLVLFFFSCQIPSRSQDASVEFRTWRDATGKFEVVAQLVEIRDGRVKLRKSDGRVITPPLSLLSAEDQKFISKWEVGRDDGNIFAGGVMEAPADAEDANASVAPSKMPTHRLPNWRSGSPPLDFPEGRKLIVQQMKRPTLSEPDPPPVFETADDEAIISIPKLKSWEDVTPPMIANQRSKQVLFGAWRSKFTEDKYTRIVMIEPRSRRATEAVQWPEVYLIQDTHPASGRVVGRGNLGSWGATRELILWANLRGKFRELLRWHPKPDSEKSPPEIKRLYLVDEHLVLARVGDTVKLWDLSKGRGVWEIAVSRWHRTALSRGRRYFAVQQKEKLVLLETATGKQLGTITLPNNDPVDLAFSPLGHKLAAVGGRFIRVFDLKDPAGDTVVELADKIDTFYSDPSWTDEDHLLVGGKTLVDPKIGFVVWTYDTEGRGNDVRAFQTGLMRGLKTGESALSAFALAIPHEAALQAKAKHDFPKSIRVRRGDSVRIQIETEGRAEEFKVRESVVAAIEKAGWTIAENANIVVTAKVYRGIERTSKYGSGNFKGQDLPYRPYVSFVEVSNPDGVLYRVVDKGRAPSKMEIGLDETLGDAIERQTVPNYRFFESLDLPSLLVDPKVRGGLGASVLTAEGFVDQDELPGGNIPEVPKRS